MPGSHNLSSLPQSFVSNNPDAPTQDNSTVEEIPVIDCNLLLNGTHDQRLQAIRDLGNACEDWGFFMIVNHGVPESLREAMMGACKDLFDLTVEEKAQYTGARPLDPIRMGTGFYSAVDDVSYWRHYVKLFVHPEFFSPTKPHYFSDIAREYAKCTRDLSMELVKGISESLGLEDNRISEALDLKSCFQIFVGNLYPACPRPEQVTGMPAHSDHGLLTLLFQNGIDGLQVKLGDHWVDVKPAPNSYIVITGDQLEIVSNGKYRSVLHRAKVSRETRMSFLSLIGPFFDTVVEPLPELVTGSSPLVFSGVKYKDYMEHQQSNKLNEKSSLDRVRVRDM